MQILITGGSGFVGRALGKYLALQGHTLTITTRHPEHIKNTLPFPSTLVKWHPDKEPFPKTALGNIETIVNLAGENVAAKKWNTAIQTAIRTSRVVGTQKLVRAIEQAKSPHLRTLISASAIGYYGDRGKENLNEQSSQGSGFLSDVCKDWERAAWKSVECGADIRTVILRIGLVLGKMGGAFEKLTPIFQNGFGSPLGPGTQWMSWIHLEDLVHLISFAINTQAVKGVFNATAPYPIENKRFSNYLAKAFGRSSFFSVPKPALKLATGKMGEALLLSSQRCSSQKIQGAGFKFTYPKLKSAFTNLCAGFQKNHKELIFEQWVPQPLEAVWQFYSNEKNVEILTPETMQLKVKSKSTPEMQKGTVIHHTFKLHGFPMKWSTEITQWHPPHSFEDSQLTWSLMTWRHTHSFTSMGKGTLITDRLHYTVPMARVGLWLFHPFAQKDIVTLFKYRLKAVAKIFEKPLNKHKH